MEPEHEVQTIKSTQNVHYIQVINLWVGLAQGVHAYKYSVYCMYVHVALSPGTQGTATST